MAKTLMEVFCPELSEKSQWRLCLILGNWAWFTTQDVADQWGDDWGSVNYQHNADEPLEYSEPEHTGRKPWKILKVAFDDTTMRTPAERDFCVSVKDINTGEAPWLADEYNEVYAGASLEFFIGAVSRSGGQVYFPCEGVPEEYK